MSNLARTLVSLPGGIPLPNVTDTDRVIASFNPHFWWSARERPTNARGVTVRDRMKGINFTGGYGDGEWAPRPMIRFNGSVYQTGAYQLPQSYTIFALGRMNAYTPASGGIVFAHRTNNGNRMYLTINPAGKPELAHTLDTVAATTAVGTAGSYCCWASYNHENNTAAIAANSASIQDIDTFTNDHKGQAEAAIGAYESGGVGSGFLNGWLEEIVIYPVATEQLGYEYLRRNVMEALAEQGGVTLA